MGCRRRGTEQTKDDGQDARRQGRTGADTPTQPVGIEAIVSWVGSTADQHSIGHRGLFSDSTTRNPCRCRTRSELCRSRNRNPADAISNQRQNQRSVKLVRLFLCNADCKYSSSNYVSIWGSVTFTPYIMEHSSSESR